MSEERYDKNGNKLDGAYSKLNQDKDKDKDNNSLKSSE